MEIAKKDKPELWARVKKEVQGDKPWSARIAQQAVQEYKRRGGGYIGGSRSKTSLANWTKQDWKYGPEGHRYLPAAAWKSLSPAEAHKLEETKRKSKTRIAPYPVELLPKLRRFF